MSEVITRTVSTIAACDVEFALFSDDQFYLKASSVCRAGARELCRDAVLVTESKLIPTLTRNALGEFRMIVVDSSIIESQDRKNAIDAIKAAIVDDAIAHKEAFEYVIAGGASMTELGSEICDEFHMFFIDKAFDKASDRFNPIIFSNLKAEKDATNLSIEAGAMIRLQTYRSTCKSFFDNKSEGPGKQKNVENPVIESISDIRGWVTLRGGNVINPDHVVHIGKYRDQTVTIGLTSGTATGIDLKEGETFEEVRDLILEACEKNAEVDIRPIFSQSASTGIF